MPIYAGQPSQAQVKWDWLTEHVTPEMQRRLTMEAARLLADPGEVDDLVQITLILGAKHCHQLRDEDKLYPWLRQILQNEAMRINRKRRREVSAPDVSPDGAGTVRSAEQEVLAGETGRMIQHAIEALPYPDRNIVIHHLYDGLGLKEIALLMNLNYHTVRSKYNRALKKIQKKIGGAERE